MMSRPVAVLVQTIALLVSVAGLANAQPSTATRPGFELLLPSGTFVPTGVQEDTVRRGNMAAVQASYGLRPDLVVTGTLGWARTRPLGLPDGARLDVLTYDVGVERRLPRRSGDRRVNVKPFTGIGVGARTYRSREAEVSSGQSIAAYISAGGELGLARVRVRLEVRDYLTWLGPAGRAGSGRRNDVAVLAGLRLALR